MSDWDKNFPDTKEGAKQFLEETSDVTTTEETEFIADPYVPGVWKATNLDWDQDKVFAIIYLRAGREKPDAHGNEAMNDFEICYN